MSRGPDAATATLTKRVFDKKKKKTVPRIMDRGVEETQLSRRILLILYWTYRHLWNSMAIYTFKFDDSCSFNALRHRHDIMIQMYIISYHYRL